MDLQLPTPMQDARPTPSLDPANPPVLDAGSLAQLRQLDPTGAAGFVQRVLGTYVQSLEQHESQAREARAAGDWERFGRIAHTLKSASASVGAQAFSALCADIEGRIRRQELGGIDALAERFFQEVARVLLAVREHLGPAAA